MRVDLLLKYGAVCFIPMPALDAVQLTGTWQGQTIAVLVASDELPGYLGYFTLAGLPDPSLEVTDPGLAGEATQV